MDKWIVIVFIILPLMICGCVDSSSILKNFNVAYTASNGNNMLEMICTINNGEIISCFGEYTSNGNTEDFDMNKLKNKEYNVPLEIPTHYSLGQPKEKEVHDGFLSYKWTIFVD